MNHRLNNLLIISGTGRNTGKTSIAEFLIHQFSSLQQLIALKISPHAHFNKSGKLPIYQTPDYKIFEEKEIVTGKDSARLLKAGATKSYYIEANDVAAFNAFHKIYNDLEPSIPIICESPALRNKIQPGIFIVADHLFVQNKKESIKDQLKLADIVIDITVKDWQTDLNEIKFESGSWNFNS